MKKDIRFFILMKTQIIISFYYIQSKFDKFYKVVMSKKKLLNVFLILCSMPYFQSCGCFFAEQNVEGRFVITGDPFHPTFYYLKDNGNKAVIRSLIIYENHIRIWRVGVIVGTGTKEDYNTKVENIKIIKYNKRITAFPYKQFFPENNK